MDLSRTVAVPQPRPVPGGRALVALSIAALLAIGFVVEEVSPYLRWDPEALARTGRDAGGCWRTSPRAQSHC